MGEAVLSSRGLLPRFPKNQGWARPKPGGKNPI